MGYQSTFDSRADYFAVVHNTQNEFFNRKFQCVEDHHECCGIANRVIIWKSSLSTGLRSNKAKAKRLSFGTPDASSGAVVKTLSPVLENKQSGLSGLSRLHSASPVSICGPVGCKTGSSNIVASGDFGNSVPDSPGMKNPEAERDAELAGRLRRQSLNGDIPVSLAALRVNLSGLISCSVLLYTRNWLQCGFFFSAKVDCDLESWFLAI